MWMKTWAITTTTARSSPTHPRCLRATAPSWRARPFIYDYLNLARRKDFTKRFPAVLEKYFPGIPAKAVREAIDEAYAEYERHMVPVRAKGAEIIARAARKTGTSSCWPAGPTMLTLRSTTASTSSLSGRARPS